MVLETASVKIKEIITGTSQNLEILCNFTSNGLVPGVNSIGWVGDTRVSRPHSVLRWRPYRSTD